MIKIEKRPSGYIITFSGVINEEEMQRWVNDSKIILLGETSTSFGVIINMKDAQPFTKKVQALAISGQRLYKEKGMKRSAVILNSARVCQQLKNLAIQSGIYTTERYLDASIETNPIDKAINWVKNAIDPDK
jgi:hypothetical protein